MLAGLGQAVVLRNMRRDVHLAQRRNVVAGVVGFVLADRDSSSRSFGFLLEHRLRGTPLGDAAGLCDGAVNSKTVAVSMTAWPNVDHCPHSGAESVTPSRPPDGPPRRL